jgi:hypothetical protein
VVNLPHNDNGKVDIFIDDSIGEAPDLGEIPLRVSRAIPLAIHTLARPLSEKDIVPRKDISLSRNFRQKGG